MKADPEHNRDVLRLAAVGFEHHLLEFDGCSQRVNCTGELDQSAITHQLDYAPAIPGHEWLETSNTMVLQSRNSTTLIPANQAGIADNVGGDDRRQFALLTSHGNFPRLLQWIVEGPGLPGKHLGVEGARAVCSQESWKNSAQFHRA